MKGIDEKGPRLGRPSKDVPALRGSGLSLLGGAGLAAVLSLLGPTQGPTEISLAPLVADLAPTLVLPVSMNERVDRWMERYLTDQRPVFEKYLARGKACIPG